jgi:hypothetical protein
MCVTLGWDKTAMVLTYFDTKKGIAVAQPKLWTAKDEKDALDGLMPTTVVECDGCKCWQPFPPTPWAAVPPLSANHPVILNYKVVLQVTGVQVRTKFGLCVPPGTKVQGADGKWHEIAGHAGGGGGEKPSKPGGKKKPKKRR